MKLLIILVLMFSLECLAIPHNPLDIYTEIDNKKFPISTDVVEYANVPRFQTQDGFPEACFTVLGGAYMDTLNCKYTGKDCTKLDDGESFSRLDIARFTRTPEDKDAAQSVRSYTDMLPEDSGWSATNIVQNLINNEFTTATEKCASIDKAIVNFSDSRMDTVLGPQKSWWSALRKKYDEFQKIDPTCVQCKETFTAASKEELEKNFNIQQDNTKLLKIFSSQTYGIFLQKLLVPPACQRTHVGFEGPRDVIYKEFPPKGNSDYKTSIETIAKTLKQKEIPVIVSGVCDDPDFAPKKKCKELHNFMITGYRKLCSNDKPPACRDSIKVYNTYGKSWQDLKNGGWVDAESVLNRTEYKAGTLAWVESPPGWTPPKKK